MPFLSRNLRLQKPEFGLFMEGLIMFSLPFFLKTHCCQGAISICQYRGKKANVTLFSIHDDMMSWCQNSKAQRSFRDFTDPRDSQIHFSKRIDLKKKMMPIYRGFQSCPAHELWNTCFTSLVSHFCVWRLRPQPGYVRNGSVWRCAEGYVGTPIEAWRCTDGLSPGSNCRRHGCVWKWL